MLMLFINIKYRRHAICHVMQCNIIVASLRKKTRSETQAAFNIGAPHCAWTLKNIQKLSHEIIVRFSF